jgi:hypothetical protein
LIILIHKFITMKTSAALAGGLAGTFTIAVIHESLKKVTNDAPRMELLDMEAFSKTLQWINMEVPERDDLLRWTMAAEIASHTLYYGFVGLGNKKGTWFRGIALGLIAGFTAVMLPKPLGLKGAPGNRTKQTTAMTVALYLIGGLAASAVSKLAAD